MQCYFYAKPTQKGMSREGKCYIKITNLTISLAPRNLTVQQTVSRQEACELGTRLSPCMSGDCVSLCTNCNQECTTPIWFLYLDNLGNQQ